ncbi:MAG TPA: hypothetical protein VIR38_02455 [Thalassobaculum sp.]
MSAAAALAAASPAAGKDYYDKSRDVKRIAWMDRGMDMVRSILKDGDSAKFRGVFFSDGGGVPTSCGEVNAKNAFGGYRGFQRFMSAGSTELTFIEEQVTDFGTVWAKFCR